LCEMGAAWVTSGVVIPVIVEPIDYSTLGIIQQPTQIEKLLDEKSLDRIKDITQESLSIPPGEIKSDRWTGKKYEFIEKAKKLVASNPFSQQVSREDFEKALQEKSNMEKSLKALITEKGQIEEYLEKVNKTKDAVEIKAIEKVFKGEDVFDEFVGLCKKVAGYLSKLQPIIRGIAFAAYSKKEVSVKYDTWKEKIDDEIARDYISTDFNAD